MLYTFRSFTVMHELSRIWSKVKIISMSNICKGKFMYPNNNHAQILCVDHAIETELSCITGQFPICFREPGNVQM